MSCARTALSLAFAMTVVATCGTHAAAAPPFVPRSVRPGEIFVLRLPPAAPTPESALFLERSYPPLSVSGESGTVFLLGVDLDASPGTQTIVIRREGGGEERLTLHIAKRDFPEERLQLPAAMVTPPKEFAERIAREQALAAEVYRTSDAVMLWDRGFTRPLAQKAVGNFGRRRILNGIARSPHAGQDYTAPYGTPVKAVAAGRVRLARDFYFSGLTVLVDHGVGLVSQYLHLEKMLVAEGDTVSAGQTLGLVGSTGRATGPHLHLGMRLFEQRVDPELLWDLF